MTKNKTSDQQEEIDVFGLFNKISKSTGKIFKNSLDLFVEIFSKWKILLAISVIAYILGVVYENKNQYQPGDFCGHVAGPQGEELVKMMTELIEK